MQQAEPKVLTTLVKLKTQAEMPEEEAKSSEKERFKKSKTTKSFGMRSRGQRKEELLQLKKHVDILLSKMQDSEEEKSDGKPVGYSEHVFSPSRPDLTDFDETSPATRMPMQSTPYRQKQVDEIDQRSRESKQS